MTRSARRGPWLPEEDQTLLQLVISQGPNNWVRISQHMQHRSAKQCRERYHQNLKPSLNHDPISAEEGEEIERMVREMGKRWAEIARRLGNRSDNAVKNWYNGSQNRKKRHEAATGHNQRAAVGPRSQPISATRTTRSTINANNRHQPKQSQPQQYGWNEKPAQAKSAAAPSQRFPAIQPSAAIYSAYDPRILDADRERPSTTPIEYTFPSEQPRTRNSPHASMELQPLIPSPHPRSHPLPPLSAPSRPNLENSLVSPVGSEASRPPSLRRAPSLISDNQSSYSTSPQTIASPRPNMPAPIDTTSVHLNSSHNTRLWGDLSAQNHAANRRAAFLPGPVIHHRPSGQARASYSEEGYSSTLGPSSTTEPKYYGPAPEAPAYQTRSQDQFRIGLDPLLTMPSPVSRQPGQTTPELSPISARDTRMHVSNLLG